MRERERERERGRACAIIYIERILRERRDVLSYRREHKMDRHGREQLHENLPYLQNLIKRDPSMYKDDFLIQLAHFESQLKLFELRIEEDKGNHFGRLVNFLGQCMPCYPKEMSDAKFTERIGNLLREKYESIRPKLRAKLVATLVLVRNRGLLDAIGLFNVLFPLFECEDKQLRASITSFIISDVKKVAQKNSNAKTMRTIKSFVYKCIEEGSQNVAARSLYVLVELYKRRVWNDERTVNVIAEACFSEVQKVSIGAMRFFLGVEQEMERRENDEDELERKVFMSELPSSKKRQHSKLTRKRKRQMERAAKKVKKFRAKEKNARNPKPLFRAIEIINNPQGFAERLFKHLKIVKCTFDNKMIVMDLLSRTVGSHKLFVLNFYSYVQRYLNSPTQKDVTRILAALLQSCHDQIPSDELLSVVRTIADAFVVDRRPADVICIGINAVRGILTRVPHILEERPMQALVGDLVQFKKNRDKGVVVAARGLIGAIRELYPTLLSAKDRGRDHVKEKRPDSFGALKAVEYDSEEISRLLGDNDNSKNQDFDGNDDDGELSEDSDEDGIASGSAIVDPSDLEGLTKKLRQRKEERLAKVRAGRSQFIKEKRGGSTNLEKTRKKNFNMVQQSTQVRAKLKRSLKQEQRSLKKRIKKMRMDAKCSGKKINKRRK